MNSIYLTEWSTPPTEVHVVSSNPYGTSNQYTNNHRPIIHHSATLIEKIHENEKLFFKNLKFASNADWGRAPPPNGLGSCTKNLSRLCRPRMTSANNKTIFPRGTTIRLDQSRLRASSGLPLRSLFPIIEFFFHINDITINLKLNR